MKLNNYIDMWTINKDKYALFEITPNVYAIVDIETKSAVLIEDSNISEQVKKKMIDSGNRVIDKNWFNN
ncbi:hypothetical protein [Paenibacillus hunanensis]|uniref:MBL fold metallo-hydrolase n=1 Tax=Paenibacillus hunanensis TaxID=539262 RepID=A0ABU1J4B0_9BACL|nr:hypothetical protein [Paenibacillus hunanensis]MDR6246341.1 hypothetical protein [Paenibacillus hunanensis]GGJ30503.1 hypothetical protein GCM10008022_44090 [Paenibacillus hunanensis]